MPSPEENDLQKYLSSPAKPEAKDPGMEAYLAGGSAPPPAAEPAKDEESDVLRYLSLAGEGASFGLLPKVVKAGEALGIPGWNEKAYIDYVNESRDKLGPMGTVAEIAGGMLVPIPGLGLAKGAVGATRLAKGVSGALRHGVAHGIVGAGAAAVNQLGETPTDEIVADPLHALSDAGSAAATGGAFAGALGAAGRGIGQAFRHNRAALATAASGGTKDDYTRIIKQKISPTAGDAKLRQVTDIATKGVPEFGIKPALGVNYLQRVKTTEGLLNEGRLKAGILLENARKDLTNIAQKKGIQIDPQKLFNDIASEVEDAGSRYFTGSTEPVRQKLENEILDAMRRNGGNDLRFDQLREIAEKFQNSVWGIRGNDTLNTALDHLSAVVYGKLSEAENKLALSIDKKLGRQFPAMKTAFHAYATLHPAAMSGVRSELGLMQASPLGPDFGGLRGFFIPRMHELRNLITVGGAGLGANILTDKVEEATGKDLPMLHTANKAAVALGLLHASAAQRARMNNSYLRLGKDVAKIPEYLGPIPVKAGIRRLPERVGQVAGKMGTVRPTTKTQQQEEDEALGIRR